MMEETDKGRSASAMILRSAAWGAGSFGLMFALLCLFESDMSRDTKLWLSGIVGFAAFAFGSRVWEWVLTLWP